MSLNKVRISPQSSPPFPELFPDEKLYFTSTTPIQMEYDNSGGYPGSGQQLLVLKGNLFISNIRIIYIALEPKISFTSLALPLQNLEDCKVADGFLGFGGSTLSGSVKSVQDEGFTNDWGTLKLSFPSSTQALDFKNIFEHMRSRLGTAPMQYVEPLPQYDEYDPSPSSAAGPSSTLTLQPPPPPPSYH